jgi:hypothetical protein
LWQLRDNEVKYIYIILLFLFVSVPALAQDFSLSKDKKQENAIEDYVIRPPQKLNYTAICQQNNQLNQAQVKYFLQQELEGRFNAEKYYYLAMGLVVRLKIKQKPWLMLKMQLMRLHHGGR